MMAAAVRRAVIPAIFLVVAGCGGDARPHITRGMPCDGCSMEIQDLRFACAQRFEGKWRHYDAIECMLRGAHAGGAGSTWLSDYDSRTLHPADSMWVVRGDFPSPMGGGFAAFTGRDAAVQVARETRGRVQRLNAFVLEAR